LLLLAVGAVFVFGVSGAFVGCRSFCFQTIETRNCGARASETCGCWVLCRREFFERRFLALVDCRPGSFVGVLTALLPEAGGARSCFLGV